jgi:hypothetical protein
MPRRRPVAGARSGVPPPYPSRPWSIRYVVLNLDLKYSQHPTTSNPNPPTPPNHRDREGWPAPRRPRTRPRPGPEACRQSCSGGPAATLRLPGKSHITYPARLTWAPPWGPLGGRPRRLHLTYPAKGRKHESLPDARQLRLWGLAAPNGGGRPVPTSRLPGRSHITYPAKSSGRCPGGLLGASPRGRHLAYPAKTPKTRKPPRCTPATPVGSRGPERRGLHGGSQGTVTGRCARSPRILPGRWRASWQWIGGLAG